MADKKISELDAVLQINNDAVFPMSQDNAGEPTTFKAGITQLGAEIAEDMTFSNLQTASKKIVGAINEIAQGGGGTTDYDDLENKPQINSVELSGNKSLDDLGIQPSEISKTASGSIATFTDGGNGIPVKSFECEIVAQQASGTPTPSSPLPISGFSQADISVCGKNLASDIITGYIVSSSGVISSSGQANSIAIAPVKSGKNYTITTDDTTGFVGGFFTSKPTIGSTTYNGSRTISTSKTFTAPIDGWVAFRTSYEYSTPQCELGNEATTYEPYKGNLYTVSFGQTIYGGRLIYVNGSWAIEATHEILTLYGTERISLTGTGTGRRFRFDDTFTYNAMPLSSHFIESTGNSNPWGYYRLVSGYLLLTDNNSQMADETALKTWLANQYSGGTPVQFLCELATPVIIPITSSTRVKTISGANNIFSNTGDVSLEYFTENADEIAELVEAELDDERQEHNVVKSYTAQLTSSQYGWFTFVDENGNDLLVTNGVPLSASAIADTKYYSGLFVQQPSGKILFKVVDVNNSSASSFAPIGTSLSNITFNLSYLKF